MPEVRFVTKKIIYLTTMVIPWCHTLTFLLQSIIQSIYCISNWISTDHYSEVFMDSCIYFIASRIFFLPKFDKLEVEKSFEFQRDQVK